MSATSDVLLWAQRVVATKASAPHVLLGVHPDATLDEAQTAFHEIARKAHPDLHRGALAAEDHELITEAYSLVAGAYQSFRVSVVATAAARPIGEPPVTPSGPAPATGVAGTMSSRALVHFRKAELALRRGDFKAAVLQLKMAIAADPHSAFLRTALAEVESELRKP
jgi:hypothetical protein